MKITQPSLLPGMPELEAPRTTIVHEHVRRLPRRKDRNERTQRAPRKRKPRIGPLHEAVLLVLRSLGEGTDAEIEARYWDVTDADGNDLPVQSASGLRTRRAELVRAGRIEASPDKRTLRSGRHATVWRETNG